jgi:hypothetical protein
MMMEWGKECRVKRAMGTNAAQERNAVGKFRYLGIDYGPDP